MNVVCRLFSSSIGRKTLMALSGLALSGFLVGHLAGNILIFLGQDAINAYAAGLKGMPALLWGARLGLLFFFVLHIYLGVTLSLENRAARPIPYTHASTVQASAASRSMIYTGMLVLFFVIYHLLHFTLWKIQPDVAHMTDGLGRHDVYSMVVHGFSHPLIVAIYVFAQICLGLHLCHGFSSLFQSLGINHPKYNGLLRALGPMLSTLIAVGNISIALSVYFGFIPSLGGI